MENYKKTAALLLGHGSRVREANENMLKVMNLIREKSVFLTVQAAFLELSPPTIADGIRACVEKGAEKIIAAPYFLHSGMHVKRDLPNAIKTEAAKYPGLKITYARNIGFHPVLVEIMMDRLMEASCFENILKINVQAESEIVNAEKETPSPGTEDGHGHNHTSPVLLKPREIEAESFRIIKDGMNNNSFNPYQLPIAQRVIHTTGDQEFAKLIFFQPGFFSAAKAVISGSKSILTDVNMAMAGANRNLLNKFGMEIHCHISDPDIIEESNKTGLTRASLAIRKGASDPNLGGIVVGNAPTALREVIRLVSNGEFKPGFVIAAPVGFVDAEESKEAWIQSRAPGVAIRGKKGGSPIAVAILNAVLMLYGKFGDRIVEGDVEKNLPTRETGK